MCSSTRLRAPDRHTSPLASNLRVIRDLVCDLMGILDPGSGLIRPSQRGMPNVIRSCSSGTATADAFAKAHDGVAMNAGNALGGADALAFCEAGDNCHIGVKEIERLIKKLELERKDVFE